MEELGGPEVCCRLGADIELNGTPYAEKFIPIPVNWSFLDGNGHKIRNIYISDPANRVNAFRVMISGNITITGLFLENAVLCGTVVTLFLADSGVKADIKLHDCSLILKVINMSTTTIAGELCVLHGSNLTVSPELSVISLSASYNKGYAIFNGETIKRCQIIIDIIIHNKGDSGVLETALFRNSSVSDSWITGRIHCDVEASYCSYHMTDYNSQFSNFYQAVEMQGLNSVYWNNSFSSVCFYDNDLMSGAEYKSRDVISSLFHGLTTEQCKDPEYLTSIGFMCAGDSNGV